MGTEMGTEDKACLRHKTARKGDNKQRDIHRPTLPRRINKFYFLNRMRKASSTFLTRTISIFVLSRLNPFRSKWGMIILVKPSFSASRTRCSMRLTGRI